MATLVSGSSQIMEIFSGKGRLQHFEPCLYCVAFLWIANKFFFWYLKSYTQFELSFRSSVVNKAVIRCCRYSYACYTLSRTLTIQRGVCFLYAITFPFIVDIWLNQPFSIIFHDDVSNVNGEH